MPKQPHTFELDMTTANYYKQIAIAKGYKFVSVINDSDNVVTIYQDYVTPDTKAQGRILVTIPINTNITVPITEDTRFTFIWDTGELATNKRIKVIFSEENLQIGGILGSPLDRIVRKEQLPPSLLAYGYNTSTDWMEGQRLTVHAQDWSARAHIYQVTAPGGGLTWALDSRIGCFEYLLQADSSNQDDILLGTDADAMVFRMPPGSTLTWPVATTPFMASAGSGQVKMNVIARSLDATIL